MREERAARILGCDHGKIYVGCREMSEELQCLGRNSGLDAGKIRGGVMKKE